MQQNRVWDEVLARLEKRINRPSFNTWLRPTKLLSMTDQSVCIGVPDDVFVYWLGEYYVPVIVEILTDILHMQPDISFVVMEHEEESAPAVNTAEPVRLFPREPGESRQLPLHLTTTAPAPTVAPRQRAAALATSHHHPLQHGTNGQSGPATRWPAQRPPEDAPFGQRSVGDMEHSLNPRYTFDSFVVGSGNRLPHAAAMAVAERKAVNYNPLFIYGGVGLGKTHLLHAIGNHMAGMQPSPRILYLSAEQFINDFVASVREDRMAAMRKKYREIDLLLIDDIQFIARKERTQEEFFHTFNTLYHERKQIVLTSDCPPKKIPTIAEQLRSRFEWGLIADIQAPDLETRIAILKKKAETYRMPLSDEIALYIASQVKANIRELEGCLSKLNAYATLTGQVITLESARKRLQDICDTPPKKITIELVQQAVANHYQIAVEMMVAQGRSRDVTFARHIAMYLARELTKLSLPDIGRNFGGRDHTTVIHACKQVEKFLANDLNVQKSVTQLRNLLQA